jgi:competence protein ComEA
MRTGYFYSLVFALLTSASIAAVAAPAVKPEAGNAPQVQQMSAATPSGKVDLNKADASTLQSELSGIGEAKAQAIVAYRESNGAFSSVDELLEVKGIGTALLDKHRAQLDVNYATKAAPEAGHFDRPYCMWRTATTVRLSSVQLKLRLSYLHHIMRIIIARSSVLKPGACLSFSLFQAGALS